MKRSSGRQSGITWQTDQAGSPLHGHSSAGEAQMWIRLSAVPATMGFTRQRADKRARGVRGARALSPREWL